MLFSNEAIVYPQLLAVSSITSKVNLEILKFFFFITFIFESFKCTLIAQFGLVFVLLPLSVSLPFSALLLLHYLKLSSNIPFPLKSVTQPFRNLDTLNLVNTVTLSTYFYNVCGYITF